MRTERGIALLVALIIAILLSLLALALTFSSMKEFGTSNEFERHEKALLVADAGFNEAKQLLRGKDLNLLLQAAGRSPCMSGCHRHVADCIQNAGASG